jgi:hypothetical protein
VFSENRQPGSGIMPNLKRSRLWFKGGLRPGSGAVEEVKIGARLRIGDVNPTSQAVGG